MPIRLLEEKPRKILYLGGSAPGLKVSACGTVNLRDSTRMIRDVMLCLFSENSVVCCAIDIYCIRAQTVSLIIYICFEFAIH